MTTTPTPHIDVIRARRADRPMICRPCAALLGGMTSGWHNVDDAPAGTCARCGKPACAKVIDARFVEYQTYDADTNLPVLTAEDATYCPPWQEDERPDPEKVAAYTRIIETAVDGRW